MAERAKATRQGPVEPKAPKRSAAYDGAVRNIADYQKELSDEMAKTMVSCQDFAVKDKTLKVIKRKLRLCNVALLSLNNCGRPVCDWTDRDLQED
jgi:hypothetical protein